jgi:hypothetical protein
MLALHTQPNTSGSSDMSHLIAPNSTSGKASQTVLEPKAPSLADIILERYQEHDKDGLDTLFSSNAKEFLNALKELSKKEAPAAAAEETAEGDATQDRAINYAEIANNIARIVGADYFAGREVSVITPKDLEKAFFTVQAKNKLAEQICETELARAQAEAMWNANAKNVFTSPFNLFRTVVAVSTMAVNFFASIAYALGSVSCFADAEVKALRIETARDLLSRMGHDTLNAVCGLGQAIPFIGTFLTNMLENRRYKYETEIPGTQKHQGETWTQFTDRRLAEKESKKRIDVDVRLKETFRAPFGGTHFPRMHTAAHASAWQ